MKSYKTICHLQDIKIKLLEEFILESAKLVDKYEWVADNDDMIKLDQLSRQLDEITKKIEYVINKK